MVLGDDRMEREAVKLFGEKYMIERPEKEFSPRRYQMVVTDYAKKKVIIPIKDRNGNLEEKSCLANLDHFTVKFKNEKELLLECKRQGFLTLAEGSAEIVYSSSRRKKPIALSIAYQDDLVLSNFMIKDRNESQVSSTLIEMVGNLFIDLENKIYREYLKNSEFLKQDFFYLIYDYPFHFSALEGDIVSDFERSLIQENKRKIIQDVIQYFSDSYKRIRGLYFANKEFHRLYPQVILEEDRISEMHENKEQKPIITEFMIDPNDPFERPEVQVETYEENDDTDTRTWEGEQLSFSDYKSHHGGTK